ncbi:MAG: NAD(P)/FAD-dependent oxidoreductase, partial [Minisyncoccia bacterium]
MKKIVILGGGFGGVYALKNLLKNFKNEKEIELILVNEKNYFLFTPLLHEAATGGVSLSNIIEPLREVFKCRNLQFIQSKVLKINLDKNKVLLKCGEINYDYLIIALGSKTNFYDVFGAEKYTFTLKTINDAIKLKNHFIHLFEKAVFQKENINELLTFVIVGGGPTGIELAAEMKDLFFETFKKIYPQEIIKQVKIIIIDRNEELI